MSVENSQWSDVVMSYVYFHMIVFNVIEIFIQVEFKWNFDVHNIGECA